MNNDDWDSAPKATPPDNINDALNVAQTPQPKHKRSIVPDNLVLDNSFTPEDKPQTEEETHITHSAQSDWDSVSSDTPTDSKTDDWDSVSTPERDKPPIKETSLQANISSQYQQEERPAEEPAPDMQGLSSDLAAAMQRRRSRQQGQPIEEEPEVIPPVMQASDNLVTGEPPEQPAAREPEPDEEEPPALGLTARRTSTKTIRLIPREQAAQSEQQEPDEEIIEAPRRLPKSRAARPPVKRGGLKGSSIAIIILCIAVIGLSVFSALSIFHVVNFNRGILSISAIIPKAPQTQGLTSGQIEATNIVINANASATALTSLEQAGNTPTSQQIYTQATSGTPAVDDPLTDNKNGWDQFLMDWGGECTFVNASTYHIIIPNLGHSLLCTSSVLSHFDNFAMQISINPVQGDFAALVFGQNANGYYSTDIHTDGEYALFDSVNSKFLIQGSSTAIKQGLNQTNVITIVVNNNQFYFYANGQLLMSYYLSNYVAGSIDVAAVSRTQAPVDIEYSNLKIWGVP